VSEERNIESIAAMTPEEDADQPPGWERN
jgi:hypothetical protein